MFRINNKGFGFIPVLVLSLLVGVSALVGYKYYSTNSENVLQMSSPDSSVNIRFQYGDQNKKSIEVIIFGNDAENFVRNLSNENRVSQSGNGKNLTVNYPNFTRTANGYSTKFPIADNSIDKIVFLDLKLSNLVRVANTYPWEYDEKINGIKKISKGEVSQLDVTVSYSESNLNSSKITLSIKGKEGNLSQLNNELKKYGLLVNYYCSSVTCMKPTTIKPKTTFSKQEMILVVEIPTSSMVKSISYDSYPQNDFTGMPKLVFNSVDKWDVVLKTDDRKFDLIRKKESFDIGVYLKSFNKNTGQQNLEVLINGYGDEQASLARALRLIGLTRVDLVGGKEVSTIVKPNVMGNGGQFKVNITSQKNTKALIFPNSSMSSMPIELPSRYEFLPIPSGWSVNKDENGLERLIESVPPRINVTKTIISGSSDLNFNFTVFAGKTDLEYISSIVRNSGVTVTKCTGETSCFYPVQKPTVVCSSDVNLGCKFTIRVPNDATKIYINYEGKGITSSFQTLPIGWRADSDGYGINKQ